MTQRPMYLEAPPENLAAAKLLGRDLEDPGYVTNRTRLWAWRPDLCDAFAATRSLLMAQSSLAPRELCVMACAMAGTLGDPYGALTWGIRLAAASGEEVAAAVIHGADCGGLTARESALAGWARAVARDPTATRPRDVEPLRAAGLAEREIFEATVFVAFRAALSMVDDALGVQPDWQLVATAPRKVRAAVAIERAIPPRSAE